jgi:outer membrane protein TolC
MKRIFTSVLLCVALGSNAQNAYTLQGAIDYALANNATYLNSIVDQQLAEMKRKEIRGIGLPQIGGSFDVTNMFIIPTQLIPADAFDLSKFIPGAPSPAPGTYNAVQFGIQYNATAGVTASQLIFSSDYIVALQASKAYQELSQVAVNRTAVETKVNVTKAYYNVLVSRERAKMLDIQLTKLKKLQEDVKIMNDNGVVEKLDLDRITLAYNNLMAEQEKVSKLVGLTEYLLKFQMGLAMNEAISLSDSLMPVETAQIVSPTSNYAGRYDYVIAETALTLQQLELKRQKLKYLPTLAAFGTYSQSAMRPELNLFANEKWYPTGIVGLKMSIPIWDGGQTYFIRQQAKLNVLKAENNLKMMKQVVDLEVQSSSTIFNNAVISLNNQKKNIELAKEVYDASKIKYEQGVGSISDVLDAETALKEAQINYYDALYQYHVAKADYDKATGSIK